jgi:hypothetical protein
LARSASPPAKRAKQRSKANAVLTKDHPNPGFATTGYSTTSTTPTGGPPHASKSEHVRSRIFIRPDSNAGTEITRRSLSPPKRLRILHGPASPASRTNHFTMTSLIDETVASTEHDVSFKSLESNKAAPAKKKTLFKRFLKASSCRKQSRT